VGAQRVEEHGQPALHVVDAGPEGATLGDAERALARGARGKDRVEVADEEEPLGPGPRLLGQQMVAEALLGDARDGEAEPGHDFGQHRADPVDVGPVVGAAVLVDEASQEVELLVAPLGEAAEVVAHLARMLVGRRRPGQARGGNLSPRRAGARS
jgi:hypothetical protein